MIKALVGLLRQQTLQHLPVGGLQLELSGHAPPQAFGIQQLLRRPAGEQGERRHPEPMEIHPGRRRFAPALRTWGIGRRGTVQGLGSSALQQPEINQHWQSVLIAAQKVAGIDVAMHQFKTVQHRQR